MRFVGYDNFLKVVLLMFYNRYSLLCSQKGVSCSFVLQDLGLSTGNLKAWKDGRVPKQEILVKIAEYFGVSVDYLLGNTDIQTPDRSQLTDADIKFALFGGDAEYKSDEAFEDVRRFAQIIAEKEKAKGNI